MASALTEELMKLDLDDISDAMYIIEAEGQHYDKNSKAGRIVEQLMGYTSEELIDAIIELTDIGRERSGMDEDPFDLEEIIKMSDYATDTLVKAARDWAQDSATMEVGEEGVWNTKDQALREACERMDELARMYIRVSKKSQKEESSTDDHDVTLSASSTPSEAGASEAAPKSESARGKSGLGTEPTVEGADSAPAKRYILLDDFAIVDIQAGKTIARLDGEYDENDKYVPTPFAQHLVDKLNS